MTDFNESGKNYSAVAIRAQAGDHGVLPRSSTERLVELRHTVGKQWNDANSDGRRHLGGALGTIDRLSAFLLQVSRVAAFADALRKAPLKAIGPVGTVGRLPPGSAMAATAHPACTEFESLLFHGRAALDRLTLFIAAEYGQRCDRFSRLVNILGNQSRDPRGVLLLDQLGKLVAIPGVLSGKGALRSRVAHGSSIPEGIRRAFTVHRLHDGRYLIFDCEALGHPVLATARALAVEVSFVIVNAVGSYLMNLPPLPLEDFEPPWHNPTIVFSEYIDSSNTGPRVTVFRMLPNGFHIDGAHLRDDVFDRAFEAMDD